MYNPQEHESDRALAERSWMVRTGFLGLLGANVQPPQAPAILHGRPNNTTCVWEGCLNNILYYVFWFDVVMYSFSGLIHLLGLYIWKEDYPLWLLDVHFSSNRSLVNNTCQCGSL